MTASNATIMIPLDLFPATTSIVLAVVGATRVVVELPTLQHLQINLRLPLFLFPAPLRQQLHLRKGHPIHTCHQYISKTVVIIRHHLSKAAPRLPNLRRRRLPSRLPQVRLVTRLASRETFALRMAGSLDVYGAQDPASQVTAARRRPIVGAITSAWVVSAPTTPKSSRRGRWGI